MHFKKNTRLIKAFFLRLKTFSIKVIFSKQNFSLPLNNSGKKNSNVVDVRESPSSHGNNE